MNLIYVRLYVPRCGIAGSYCVSRFNFLRNCQMVFQSGCSILQSHQQCIRVPISAHPKAHFQEILADKSATKSIGSKWKMLTFLRSQEHVYVLVCRFQRKSIDGSFGSSDGKKNPWFQFKLMSSMWQHSIWYFCLSDFCDFPNPLLIPMPPQTHTEWSNLQSSYRKQSQ